MKNWSLTCRSPTPCWKGKVGVAFGFCFLGFYLCTLCVCVVVVVVVPVAFLCLFGGRGWGVGACMHVLEHACAFSAHMPGHMLPHAHTLMRTPGPSLPIAVCLFFFFPTLSLFSPFSQSLSPSEFPSSLFLSLFLTSPLPPPPPPPPVSPSFSLNVILSL